MAQRGIGWLVLCFSIFYPATELVSHLLIGPERTVVRQSSQSPATLPAVNAGNAWVFFRFWRDVIGPFVEGKKKANKNKSVKRLSEIIRLAK